MKSNNETTADWRVNAGHGDDHLKKFCSIDSLRRPTEEVTAGAGGVEDAEYQNRRKEADYGNQYLNGSPSLGKRPAR